MKVKHRFLDAIKWILFNIKLNKMNIYRNGMTNWHQFQISQMTLIHFFCSEFSHDISFLSIIKISLIRNSSNFFKSNVLYLCWLKCSKKQQSTNKFWSFHKSSYISYDGFELSDIVFHIVMSLGGLTRNWNRLIFFMTNHDQTRTLENYLSFIFPFSIPRYNQF